MRLTSATNERHGQERHQIVAAFFACVYVISAALCLSLCATAAHCVLIRLCSEFRLSREATACSYSRAERISGDVWSVARGTDCRMDKPIRRLHHNSMLSWRLLVQAQVPYFNKLLSCTVVILSTNYINFSIIPKLHYFRPNGRPSILLTSATQCISGCSSFYSKCTYR